MGYIWLILIAAFAIVEGLTVQLVSLWFAIGSIGGLIAYALGASLPVQIVVALAIAVILMLSLRKFVSGILKPKDIKTNADSLVGRNVVVTRRVDNLKNEGEGKINGLVWKLRSEDGSVIDENETVEIREIRGVTLIVAKPCSVAV